MEGGMELGFLRGALDALIRRRASPAGHRAPHVVMVACCERGSSRVTLATVERRRGRRMIGGAAGKRKKTIREAGWPVGEEEDREWAGWKKKKMPTGSSVSAIYSKIKEQRGKRIKGKMKGQKKII